MSTSSGCSSGWLTHASRNSGCSRPCGRSSRQAGDHQGGVVTEFGFLPTDDGFDTLHVPGEILIARDDYEPRPDPDRQVP